MNSVLLILIGSLVAALLLWAGLYHLLQVLWQRRRSVSAAEFQHEGPRRTALDELDVLVRRTRVGKWLDRETDLAGIQTRPTLLLLAAVAVAIMVTWLLWRFIAPVLAVVGLLAGVGTLRWYLRREQSRRREAFVGQLPELARILANASHAGLSLSTAVGVASAELTEPARSELGQVAQRISFGGSLQAALDELQRRVGTRETKVLVSTLLISSRSGGALVTALRDIAITLDERKEVRREVKTIFAQSVASSNLVIVLGFVILLGLNLYKPGTVERMTKETLGQIALAVGGGLFLLGSILIRRMTKVDL